MIVRTLQEAEKTARHVVSENWDSTRLLLKSDDMGFSFHITTIYANTETPLWYQNHLESVYCIEGKGEIETVDDGKIYPITPGTLYILNKHDKHLLRAKTHLKLACVFNPPLHGKEVHDGIGGYPLEAEEITSIQIDTMKERVESVYKRDAINYYDQPMRSSRYDPVKVRWEDKICQDHYRKMVNRLTEAGGKLRILDLGCGIGYGYHLISNILDDDVPIEEDCCKLLEEDDIEYYVGLDINPELVDIAKDRYKDDKKVTIIKCDFLNDEYPEKPFNIFFSSGVPFSHFNDNDFSSLLEKIFDHIKSFGTSAFLVVDVLGRYSIEWQSQWDKPSWHIYNMSFFSDGKEKEQVYMKFWGKELNDFVLEAAKKAGVKAECFDTFDRSIFIGRHIDTSNFNPNLKKMRAMVNDLFYPQQRAPLQEMFMDYTYEDGPEDVQEHYKRTTYYWNYTLATACGYLDIPIPDWFKINEAYPIPASLKSSQEQLGRVVKDKERYKQTDDFRADVFEPLLGQLLRNIERDYSEGFGAAHTLISIFEVIP